jgi:RNA polymerase sigma-70 factor (ECF subfamily)
MPGDARLIAALLDGDEAAFSALVERLHPRIVRLCRRFVESNAAAEDVAQDTWQAVLQGLPSFEGRCSLDTWILQIAINRAKSRGVRDARLQPLSPATAGEAETFGWLGTWKRPPRPGAGDRTPEAAASDRELLRLLARALEALPEQQRLVVVLREVERLTSAEVCAILEISEENQRVLLHRGRNRLRALLEVATAEPAALTAPA